MLRFVICCDVDHDIPGYGIVAPRFDVFKEKLGWKSIECIPKMKEICGLVKDCESNDAKITWFLRSDDQMKVVFDDYAYPLRNFWNLWKKLEKQGDEIGWHPHLWRWSDQMKCWYQEISDNQWISRCLENGHTEFIKLFENLTSVRTGWGFHSNLTMKKVSDLGLMVDLSAVPGLKHRGGRDERGSHFVQEYDWSTTTGKPYFPSKEDYRRPPKKGEESLRVLEIPITTCLKRPLSRIFEAMSLLASSSLRHSVRRGEIHEHTRLQYRAAAIISSRHFRYLAKQKFKQATRNRADMVATCHSIDMLNPKKILDFEKNLKTLNKLSQSLNIPFRFLTATELATELLLSLGGNCQIASENWAFLLIQVWCVRTFGQTSSLERVKLSAWEMLLLS